MSGCKSFSCCCCCWIVGGLVSFGIATRIELSASQLTADDNDFASFVGLLPLLFYLYRQYLTLLVSSNMGKRTKKVGITGKYGTRYGSTLRKLLRKVEVAQHSKYRCQFCGKDTVKRTCVGIWECGKCRKVLAGGAYTLATAPAITVRSTIGRLRKMQAEQV